jgi:hypothetical protein
MVAVAAERVMETETKLIDRRRVIVLNLARALAPCGLHINQEAMGRELEAMDSCLAARRRAAVRSLLSRLDAIEDLAAAS